MKKELVKHNTNSLFTTHQEVNRWEGKEVELKWWLLSWLLHSCFVKLNCRKCFCFSAPISAISEYFPENRKNMLTCTRVSSFWGARGAGPAAPMWLWGRKPGGWAQASSVSPVGSRERRTEDHVATYKCRDAINTNQRRETSMKHWKRYKYHCFDSWRLCCVAQLPLGRLFWETETTPFT